MCPFSCAAFLLMGSESVSFSAVFLDRAGQNGLDPSVCCGLLYGALCAVHVQHPVRPAVLLEKPVSVSFSLLLFDRQLWGSWISSAHRYERDVECVVVASRK